jgi:AhpD family alkylhydroperoxidase
MNELDKAKIEAIIEDRQVAHKFYNANSSVYRAFLPMEEAAFTDGALTKGNKELIAIGISIIINCESCLEWHIKQALEAGMSKERIIEAIGVGIEMGGGPATVSARFAMKVLSYYTE